MRPGRSRVIWHLSKVVGPVVVKGALQLRKTHVETRAISGGCLHTTPDAKEFMRQGTLEICDTLSAISSRCLQLFKFFKMPSKTALNMSGAKLQFCFWLFWPRCQYLNYLL